MMGRSEKQFKLSAYKIPLIFLFLFGLITLRALFPTVFPFGFSQKQKYQFNQREMVFFVGDVNLFFNRSIDETEKTSISLFPEDIRPKVANVIRPVLILSEKYQIDPFWVLSVMWAESTFRDEVISKKGARGLMQIMPPTFVETLAEMRKNGIYLEADRGEDFLRFQYGKTFYKLGHDSLKSKLRHLEVGIYYLKNLLRSFELNHYYATVSYNMGPQWTRNKLKSNSPINQNHRYLNKVLKNYFYLTKNLTEQPNVTFIP
jgi:hypothetical protein